MAYLILILAAITSASSFGATDKIPTSCQNALSVETLPLDTPLRRERFRIYAAITNKCNRACPWCSVYSNPQRNSFMCPEDLAAHFPSDREFDVQLEGGEPTIHRQFWEFVDLVRKTPNAHDLILVTNGVRLPREAEKLKAYVERLGEPLKLKMSINHYLLDRDKGLIELARLLKQTFEELGGAREVIFNVRLRKGAEYGDDDWVLNLVKSANIEGRSNIFYLQKYGLGSDQEEWEEPFAVGGYSDFVLLNPDGKGYDNLIERSENMGKLE